MITHLYQHPACIAHEPGPHHPESPDRLESVMSKLGEVRFKNLTQIKCFSSKLIVDK